MKNTKNKYKVEDSSAEICISKNVNNYRILHRCTENYTNSAHLKATGWNLNCDNEKLENRYFASEESAKKL